MSTSTVDYAYIAFFSAFPQGFLLSILSLALAFVFIMLIIEPIEY